MVHIQIFLTTQGHGGPPRMSDQSNAGATSERAQTWKTIHTKHTLSQINKANMERWLRRPNDIRGPWGPKVSWHLTYRWGKTPKKPHPGNLSRPGIEPGPAAWQARMLPLAPQRWTAKWYWTFIFQIKIVCWLVVELKEKNFYPGLGLEPGPTMLSLDHSGGPLLFSFILFLLISSVHMMMRQA